MKLTNKQFITNDNSVINYYETENKGSMLLMIHAQGANSSSFFKQVQQLSKNFHIVLVDCYGHGKSTHNIEKYNLKSQGEDLIEFINRVASGEDVLQKERRTVRDLTNYSTDGQSSKRVVDFILEKIKYKG